MPPPDAISFGPFHLQPARQLLLHGGRRVEIGSRALELLVALVERAGELVTKEELVSRAWPDTVVDESNLRAQVAALRRALGDGRRGARYLVTVPGRGYRFVAPIARPSTENVEPAAARPTSLPARLTRLVGRADLVSDVMSQLQRRRFVTIVGVGGIGKTSVALAAAAAVAASFADGVCFIDLAPIADPKLVPSALATVLGLAIAAEDSTSATLAFLRERRMLLVLDSCEHVVEAAALLAEAVLKAAPGAHVLATSREPLRAEGERVKRLGPLETPPASGTLSAAEALTYPAVQLFVERASACLGDFELTDEDAPVVAEICRKLDGIALAIELVAGRIDAFGLRGVAAHLDDRLQLLTHGLRTAPPRHQTLRAALDWSFEFLPESERAVLRRLAVFSGAFPLHAAVAVAADTDVPPAEVSDRVAELVAKSLVAADPRLSSGRYRLLDTTREYALAKLVEAGELGAVSRRHAEHYRDLLTRVESTEHATGADLEWLDNVRSGLDWAFSGEGDAKLGAALTVAAVPLFVRLSMMEECRVRVERALAKLPPEQNGDARRSMELSSALAAALMGNAVSATQLGAAWQSALATAEQLADTEYQLRAHWGLWSAHLGDADFTAAQAAAERFLALAERSGDATNRAVGDRLMGGALFLLGDRQGARLHLDRMLAGYSAPVHAQLARFVIDQRTVARGLLASLAWEQGLADQALREARDVLDDAVAAGHALTVCSVLSDSACPLALLTGDFARAQELVEMLGERAALHALEIWLAWGRCFGTVVRARRDPDSVEPAALRQALEPLAGGPIHPRYQSLLAELALALGRAGDSAKAQDVIDAALTCAQSRSEHWMVAEFLRVQGELILLRGGAGALSLAEPSLHRALGMARRQGALSWELRAATSLARAWRDVGRAADARELLEPVYGRFSEGFGTSDLVVARDLLAQLD